MKAMVISPSPFQADGQCSPLAGYQPGGMQLRELAAATGSLAPDWKRLMPVPGFFANRPDGIRPAAASAGWIARV